MSQYTNTILSADEFAEHINYWHGSPQYNLVEDIQYRDIQQQISALEKALDLITISPSRTMFLMREQITTLRQQLKEIEK